MAQVWLTFEELAQFCGCAPETARSQVIENNWSRRRSRDGLERVKLPEVLMRDFICRTAAGWQGALMAETKMHDAARAAQELIPASRSGSAQVDQDTVADQTSRYLRSVLTAIQAASNGAAAR